MESVTTEVENTFINYLVKNNLPEVCKFHVYNRTRTIYDNIQPKGATLSMCSQFEKFITDKDNNFFQYIIKDFEKVNTDCVGFTASHQITVQTRSLSKINYLQMV